MSSSMRNTWSMLGESAPNYERAISSQLMQVSIKDRREKTVTLPDGRRVVEFVNCSYLGIDMRPDVIEAAKRTVEEWGVHFCCARSRFSIEPNRVLEEGLSSLFGGRAITFPSVTSAHMSALPLLASGALAGGKRMRLIFDRFAHASMQYLKPLLAAEADVVTIGHNAIDELGSCVRDAHSKGLTPAFIADGVYSMGGNLPVEKVAALSRELDFWLYIDDAHGTSIFGERGEGYALSRLGAFPQNVFLTYSLAKGFGCNGGGIVVPTEAHERLIRSFGQTYAFSGPLDFSIVGAALASLELHTNGTVKALQEKLWENVRYFSGDDVNMSPIHMHMVGNEQAAIELGERLLDRGIFVSVAFFPVVPRGRAQLRICITADHTHAQLDALKAALKDLHHAGV